MAESPGMSTLECVGLGNRRLALPHFRHYLGWVSFIMDSRGVATTSRSDPSQGDTVMRKIALFAAATGAALTLAACSEKTQDAAATTADSAVNDTQANMEAAGDAAATTATDAANAVDHAAATGAAAATDAAAAAEANVQGQSTEAAKKD